LFTECLIEERITFKRFKNTDIEYSIYNKPFYTINLLSINN